MRIALAKVPMAVALVGALAAAACGGDAESANARGTELPVAAQPDAPSPATQQASAEPMEPMEAPTPVEEASTAAESQSPASASVEPTPAPEPVKATPTPARPRPKPAATPSRSAPSDAPPPVRPAREPVPAPATVAAGTQLGLRLSDALSTESNKAGDPFEATVVEDVLAPDGMVLVPAGAVVRGRVVDSHESPSADQPAVLSLAVDAIELNGRSVPLDATVLDAQVQAGRKDSDTRTAVKVGAGAAAGAVLGKILGKDTKSAVKGAVVGAAAGGAVAAATRDGQAVMEPGARILLRLDRPLVVQR